jgi:hypothetical protein
LDISELDLIWNEVSSPESASQVTLNENVISPAPAQVLVHKPIPTPVIKKPIAKPKVVEEEETCPYNFTRGPNSGTVCGSKVKGDSSYCSRHKQYEGKETKQKKVLPQAKKLQEDKNSSEEEEVVRSELKKKIYNGYTDAQVSHMWFKKAELGEGLLYHKQTNLVCDDTKFVIGKKDGNNVLPLTQDDIKLAKSWNFKIKVTVVESENNDLVKPNTIKPKAIESSKHEEIKPKVNIESSKPEEIKPKVNIVQETKVDQENIETSKPFIIKKIISDAIKPKPTVVQETKATVVQETKKKPSLVSLKKFNIPVPQLNVKSIEKSKLQVNETPLLIKKPAIQNTKVSLNDEAKNTKKSITSLIEQQKQQKDIEDILENLTNGNDSEPDEDMKDSDLEEEDEINIDEFDEE